MEQQKRGEWLGNFIVYFLLAVIGLPLLVGAFCILVLVINLSTEEDRDRLAYAFASPPKEFCTEEDEIYQAIILHGDEWIDAISRQEAGGITATLPSGNKVWVVKYGDWITAETSGFMIPVNTFRDILQAYIFNPSRNPPTNYREIKSMGNGIFCANHSSWSFED